MTARVTAQTDSQGCGGRPAGTDGPSQRVRSIVESCLPGLLAVVSTSRILALAVVGSAARGEETWCGDRLAGDIDVAAVVKSLDWQAPSRIHAAAGCLPPGASLGFYPYYSLRRFRTLEFYEARSNAWVLWGPGDIFAGVRIRRGSDIPRWEALRLLLNRAVDCLAARAGLAPAWYTAVKVYLALGEAALVLDGCYSPTYRERWQQLLLRDSVFGSTRLLERYDSASQIKLGAAQPSGSVDLREHEDWLLAGLNHALNIYRGQDGPLDEALAAVAKDTCHPLHRLAYLARRLRQGAPCLWPLACDPIFAVWREAVRLLQNPGQGERGRLRALIAEHKAVHQPLPE